MKKMAFQPCVQCMLQTPQCVWKSGLLDILALPVVMDSNSIFIVQS